MSNIRKGNRVVTNVGGIHIEGRVEWVDNDPLFGRNASVEVLKGPIGTERVRVPTDRLRRRTIGV